MPGGVGAASAVLSKPLNLNHSVFWRAVVRFVCKEALVGWRESTCH